MHIQLYKPRPLRLWSFFLSTTSTCSTKYSAPASSRSTNFGLLWFSFTLLDSLTKSSIPFQVLRSTWALSTSTTLQCSTLINFVLFQHQALISNHSLSPFLQQEATRPRIMGENVGLEPSRRSNRERRKAQHFGHSEQREDLEELVSRFLIYTFI